MSQHIRKSSTITKSQNIIIIALPGRWAIWQVLYLEAEAHGVRGTGIGCFFDDPVHQIMGFTDNAYQSLYHFTIGTAIEDTRLTTYPPYHHLERDLTPKNDQSSRSTQTKKCPTGRST